MVDLPGCLLIRPATAWRSWILVDLVAAADQAAEVQPADPLDLLQYASV